MTSGSPLRSLSREATKAVAYLRTSSKTNVGPAKGCDKRQLAAITAYAKANGFEVVATFYDAAVSGADPVTDRAGFAEMLERLLSKGARTIIVESPDRFARDLMVQVAGHDMLKARGISLIAASAQTFFLETATFKRLPRGRYTNANHNFTRILLYHDLGARIVESSRKLFTIARASDGF